MRMIPNLKNMKLLFEVKEIMPYRPVNPQPLQTVAVYFRSIPRPQRLVASFPNSHRDADFAGIILVEYP